MIISDFNLQIPKKHSTSEKKLSSHAKMLNKNNSKNCVTCQKNKFIQICRENLENKYFPAFCFYFAKPINEILSNIETSHVILFKEMLYDDEENEYLKRFYQNIESSDRIKMLSEFYHDYKENRANICIVEQHQIMQKRFQKKEKLKSTLKKKISEQKFINDDNKILEDLSSKFNTSKNQTNEIAGKDNTIKQNLIKILTNQSNNTFKESIIINDENFLENIKIHFEQNSYTTTVHDVYEPMFTLSNENNINKNKRINLQTKNVNNSNKPKKDIETHKSKNKLFMKKDRASNSKRKNFDLFGNFLYIFLKMI